MDFQLSEEQILLRDTTRDLLSAGYDIETRNEVVESDLGFRPQMWKQMADIGILGLGFDPAESGPIEIMVALTEIGRRLAPEPVLNAALGPGSVILERGAPDQRKLLDEVVAGEKFLAFAHTEPGMRSATATVTTSAVHQGDSWILNGRKNPVLAGNCADVLIVSAALPGGGIGLFLVDGDETTPGVTRHCYPTFDAARAAQIDLSGALAEPLGDPTDATPAIQRTLVRLKSALCAEAVGAMEEALRLTTEYLKTRKQFGVTLNTFQALTQRAADMYVSLELARSMNLYAAMSIADGNYDPLIAARAKLQVGRSARHIGQEAIQLHGGIGMAWEYPVGHYAARLTAIEHTLGSSQDHLHILASQVGNYDVVRL